MVSKDEEQPCDFYPLMQFVHDLHKPRIKYHDERAVDGENLTTDKEINLLHYNKEPTGKKKIMNYKNVK